MVSETTSFKKGKGKKGYFMKRQISCCSSEETQGWTQICNEGIDTKAELP